MAIESDLSPRNSISHVIYSHDVAIAIAKVGVAGCPCVCTRDSILMVLQSMTILTQFSHSSSLSALLELKF